MGLFGGSTKTTTNEKFDSGPSSFQRPYLDDTFGAAKNIYQSAQGTPYYQGETYAGMDPAARDALAKLKAYAAGQGMDSANTLSSIGAGAAGYAGKAGSTLDRFTTMAGENPQEANLAAAARYADNPAIQGMIDANSRDVVRNLTEQQLPGIDRAASGTGNINSSRAGVAAGIARRGAEDRIGDISATIRNDAWNRGLSAAQTDRATNMSALGEASSAYGNLSRFGVDALREANDSAYGAFDRINTANAQEQFDRQGQLDADFSKWQGEDTRANDLLERYAQIVAGNQWGQSGTSNSTSKTKSSGGILSQIAGIASAAGSIAASDRRLKKNIRKIGECADGLGIYTWTYVWGGGTQIGTMADEVEKLRPWALGPKILGFQTVRYGLL